MSNQPISHLTRAQLADLALGKLTDAEIQAVQSHLETCESCRRAASAVPLDSFVGLVRSAHDSLRVTTAPPFQEETNDPPAIRGEPAAELPAGLPPELADHAKFHILRELGHGGMGVVYQAEHRLMKRPVAIKILNPRLLDNPASRARFHQEVEAAAQLDHVNIVRAHDAEQAGDLHLLVMEYIEGQTLAQVLKRQGPLAIGQACQFAQQVASGLAHAHARKMIHRDIKPQNLILTPEGTVKILDFGLARLTERPREDGLTQESVAMGTPEYMAPEQATDARQADIRSDIYSLGCTLYALLGGRPPFQGKSAQQIILSHLDKEPMPLSQLRPQVPAGLAAVVAKMMAKYPDQRYQTPAEVLIALAPFSQPGLETESEEVPAAKRRPARRGKRRALAVVAGMALLGSGGWLLAPMVFKVKTPQGTMVVEVDQPGAEVSVDEGKITVTIRGDNKPVQIELEPGQHKLRISKDGFVAVTREIELKTGKAEPIRIRLEPVKLATSGPPQAGSLPQPAKELEAFRRDQIPLEALAAAGGGDPQRAPASLVGVLGEAQPIHTQAVSSLAYSPDGRWLASGSYDRTILLRETATRRVHVLRGHTKPISALGFSKDSRRLVSASHDGTLRLWWTDRDEKPTLVEARFDPRPIWTVAVSPDGRFVAAGGESGLIRLWKWGAWENPREFAKLAGKVKIRSLAFSPDGQFLACGGDEATEKKKAARLRIYATADGTEKANLPFGSFAIFGLAFSHDGTRIAAVGHITNGRVWEIESGKQIAELDWPRFPGEWPHAFTIAWSVDDNALAVGSNYRFTLHDRSGRMKRLVWFSDAGQVLGLTISPEGGLLAAGGEHGEVLVWDTAQWKLKYLDRGHTHYMRSLAISPDGSELLSLGYEPAVLRWRLAHSARPVVDQWRFDDISQVPSVSWGPDSKTYILTSPVLIAVRNTITGKETVVSTRPVLTRDSVVTSDGRTVAAVDSDGCPRLWDLALGRDVHRFPARGRWCTLAFNADGSLLAACNEETKGLTLWNVATGGEARSWTLPSVARASAFSTKGHLLATGHDDGSILLWDPATGEKKITLGGHSARIQSLKFLPDDTALVSSAHDGTIRLWNPARVRARQVIPLGPANRPLLFALDPSGKYLFAAGRGPLIYVLRLPSSDDKQ